MCLFVYVCFPVVNYCFISVGGLFVASTLLSFKQGNFSFVFNCALH